jgi:hypothetical protein
MVQVGANERNRARPEATAKTTFVHDPQLSHVAGRPLANMLLFVFHQRASRFSPSLFILETTMYCVTSCLNLTVTLSGRNDILLVVMTFCW